MPPPSAARSDPPEVEVHLGFSGIVRAGRPVHARLEIRNDGPDFEGEYLVQERAGERPTVTWSLPLRVPAGARTVRWLTISPNLGAVGLLGGSWDLVAGWGGADSALEPVSFRFVSIHDDSFVVATITDLATGFSGLRMALDPGSVAEVQMPAVPPEEAPPELAAWEVVDAIVLELAAADRLDAPAWKAIEGRVAQGAPLLIHGAGRLPDLLPESMRPGRVPEGAGPGRWAEPGSVAEHSAMPFEPVAAGERLSFEGRPLDWAVTRRFGAGRVTVAGVNLRNLRASLSVQQPLWATLIGLSDAGSPDRLRPPARILPDLLGHAAARRSFSAGGFSFALGLAAALTIAALVVVQRASRRPRFALVAPLACALAAVPLFGLGAWSRLSEDRRPFVVVEHLGVLGEQRVTTVLELSAGRATARRLELPGWPARLHQQAGLVSRATFRFGDPALALDLRPPVAGAAMLQAERWEAAEPPFALEREEEGGWLVHNRSGRDLEQVHVLQGSRIFGLGALADGEARSLGRAGLPDPSSAAHASLAGAAGHLAGFGVAGLVPARTGGLLVRPGDGVVVGWIEEQP